MIRVLLISTLLLMAASVSAQQYNTAFGVKGEWSTLKNDLAELSVKHFFDAHNALELNLGFGRRFVWVEANHHFNFRLNKTLDFYLGYGANIGYWATTFDTRYTLRDRSFVWMGFGGNAGIEFTTNVIPLNFALDFGPAVSVLPTQEVGVKVGFSARYAIK